MCDALLELEPLHCEDSAVVVPPPSRLGVAAAIVAVDVAVVAVAVVAVAVLWPAISVAVAILRSAVAVVAVVLFCKVGLNFSVDAVVSAVVHVFFSSGIICTKSRHHLAHFPLS